MAKRQLAVFYIDANKAYFYGSNTKSVLQVELPPDVIAYMDIMNKEKFYQIIQSLVTTNKIKPVPLLILFSPYATYEKELTAKSAEDAANETQQFLSSVPYERVLSRVYKLQDKSKVVALNQDLYEAIKSGFEKVDFPTVSVVSLLLLQQVMPEIGATLNLELVAGKFESIKQYSLITTEEINNAAKVSQQSGESNKPNPLRLYGLIGVFVVLFGILIFMIVSTMQPQKVVSKKVVALPTLIPTQTTIPTPTISMRTSLRQEASVSGTIALPTKALQK